VGLIRKIYLFLSYFRLLPHLGVLALSSARALIKSDVQRWSRLHYPDAPVKSWVPEFVRLMSFYPEFRNVYYYRIGAIGLFLNFLCPRLPTLFIKTPKIGPGLFIEHGFSTIISARSIGADCWINQQVTIGYSNATDCPTIGDGVKVCAGAKVIGKVSVGNRAVIGANAVVIKDVPLGATAVGVPARIIRRER